MSRSNPAPDDSSLDTERLEQIAAFADGRLEGEAREDMVRLLASDPDAREMLAEVVALQGEVDEIARSLDAESVSEAEVGEVVQGPWSSWGRRAAVAALAVAAVLVLAVVLPRWLAPEPTVETFITELPRELVDHGVGSKVWTEWPGPNFRGVSDGQDRLPEPLGPSRSFEWGALDLDFRIAVLRGDATAARSFTTELGRVLGTAGLENFYEGTIPELPKETQAEAPQEMPSEAATEAEAVLTQDDIESALQLSNFVVELALDAETPWASRFDFLYGRWVRAAWLAAKSDDGKFVAEAAEGLDLIDPSVLLPADSSRIGELSAEIAEIRSLIEAGDLEDLAAELYEILDRRAG